MDLSVSDAHIVMAVGNYVFPFLVSYYKTKEPEYYIQVLLFGRSSENLFLVGVDL